MNYRFFSMNIQKLIQNVRSMVLCRKTERLICCIQPNKVGVWDLKKQQFENCFEQDIDMFHPTMCLNPSQPLVAITTMHHLWYVFDYEKGEIERVFEEWSYTDVLEYSRRGDIVHNVSKKLHFRPAQDLTQTEVVGEHIGVQIAVFDKTCDVIASGGWDKHVKIWLRFQNLGGWALMRSIDTRATVYTCRFNVNNRLLTQSFDQLPRLWCEDFFKYETFGTQEDIKDLAFDCKSRNKLILDFFGLPLYSNMTESWIKSLSVMNNGNLLMLDNYMNVMMLERLVPKPVILTANLALSRLGLHSDVRDAIFRSMGVLNDAFTLRDVYK